MRVLALHPDVIVFVSQVWQTTATALRSGEEGFLIDSPVYPDELEAVPNVLEQAGFAVSGVLVTHGDWDHLLARLAFPQAPLGCGEATAERLRTSPGDAQRELRAFDEEHYVLRSRPLRLGDVQQLPVPGKLALGEAEELELHPTPGHTADGIAIWAPGARVLACGDYLSPVEIPMLSPGGSLADYRATLDRLRPLVECAEWVVPGHGAPQRAGEARRVLEEDDAYLAGLAAEGAAAELPDGRSGPSQQTIHDANVTLIAPEAEEASTKRARPTRWDGPSET